MNLIDLFRAQVETRPEAPAIVECRRGRVRSFSCAALEKASARVAARLERAGLRAGDVVLVFLPMSAALYELLLGVLRAGMTAMFLDPSVPAAEMEASCALVRPRALIAVARAHWLRLRCAALESIPIKFTIGWPVPGALRWDAPECSVSPGRDCAASTPALVTFTSGSTGEPKAVIRTHGFLREQYHVLQRALALQAGEVDLTTLPIFLLANLASGVTSVLPEGDLRFPGRVDPDPILQQIQRLGIIRCAASPSFFERLLAAAHPQALAGLRKIFVGGAPVFPRLLEALALAAPQGKVHAVYGSTEAEPIADLEASEVSSADRQAMQRGEGLLAGRPVPDIDLRILANDWGRALPKLSEEAFGRRLLPAGEAGEIVVSGTHVLAGYLDGRGDEEAKVRVGERIWHRTGDAGHLDAAGRLWLLGRCSARVQDPRGTLWPLAVEGAAMAQPGVKRAALWAGTGRRVLAVEAEPGAGVAEREQLRSRLAWAGLDECRWVPRIPVDRRHNAKIDYQALASMLE